MKLTLIIAICLFQLAILSDVDAGGPKAKKTPKPQRTAAEIKAAKNKNKPPESQINAAKAKSKAEKSQARIERKEAKKEQCVMGLHKWSEVNKGKKKNKKSQKKKNTVSKSTEKNKKITNKKKAKEEKAKQVKKMSADDGKKQLQWGKAKSCRWDLKPYFNNNPTHREPFAYVCQALMVAMAVETVYAMRNKPAHPYDISVQAILDCYTPKECLHKEGEPKKRENLKGCAPRVLLNAMTNFNGDDKAFAIYLDANHYVDAKNRPKKLEFDKSDYKQHCDAMKSESHWARGYFNYKMWFSKEHLLDISHQLPKDKNKGKTIPRIEEQKKIKAGRNEADSLLNQDRRVLDSTKTASIPVMMDLLKKGPFIAVTKISERLEQYRLNSEAEINDLSKAFDMDSHPDENVMDTLTHDFFVIGYVKPEKSSEVYFLVKTCIFAGEGLWGWKGKGFLKMKTANGGKYGFNSEIYQVMPSDTKPNPSPTPSISSKSGTDSE